jgi:predicted phage terminase large subunit-like protein
MAAGTAPADEEVWRARAAARSLADEAEARDDLRAFVRWISPGHLAGLSPHIRALSDVIEEAERHPVRVLVSMPPRWHKTETVLHSVARTLWLSPEATCGFLSYSAALAHSKSRRARRLARSAGVVLSEDTKSVGEWRTDAGGGLLAAGRGGGLTGHGLDRLFVDDLLKNREEAESALIRDEAWEWLNEVAFTRLERGASAFVVGTRWHEDDPIGRLKHQGGWDSIDMPALDDLGASTAPAIRSTEELVAMREQIGLYAWSSLYQQEPRPRGAHLFREPARFVDAELPGARIAISVDTATTAKTSADWTCAVVAAYRRAPDGLLTAELLDVRRGQWETPEVCRALRDLQAQWPGAPLVIEGFGVGQAVCQVLRSMDPGLRLFEVRPLGDKFTRAQPVSAAWNAGRVRVPTSAAWLAPFLRVVTTFTGVNDATDDDVDALSLGWNWAEASVSAPATGPAPTARRRAMSGSPF